MTYTTLSSQTIRPQSVPQSVTTPQRVSASNLETCLQAALEHARRLTMMRGTADVEVAIAWETVEELETAKAQQQQTLTPFAQYCANNPGAPECRIYGD